jgi:hypothetical protein
MYVFKMWQTHREVMWQLKWWRNKGDSETIGGNSETSSGDGEMRSGAGERVAMIAKRGVVMVK